MRRLWRVFGLWWARLAFWLGAYRVLAGHLGRLGDLLEASWGRLGPSWIVSWSILGRLGSSGRRLGLDFLPKWSKIEAFLFECHFLFNL